MSELITQKGLASKDRELKSDPHLATMDTVLAAFIPECLSIGLFYLTKANRRKKQGLGLMEQYLNNENKSLLIRCSVVLAFVPGASVIGYFNVLSGSLPQDVAKEIYGFMGYIP